MISIGVPNLTGAQVAAWVLNKPVPIQSFAGGFYDPAFPTTALSGQLVQILVNDSRWPEVKSAAVSLAILAGLQRVRVVFDGLDPSKTAGRPANDVAWVYADGTQGD